jgi:hypothetical protein
MIRKTVLLVVLLIGCSACTKWGEPRGLASSLGAEPRPESLKLVMADREGVLEAPRMVGDSITGLTRDLFFARGYERGSCPGEGAGCVAVAMPADKVMWVEVRESDGKKTASWIFLGASVAALATCLALC